MANLNERQINFFPDQNQGHTHNGINSALVELQDGQVKINNLAPELIELITGAYPSTDAPPVDTTIAVPDLVINTPKIAPSGTWRISADWVTSALVKQVSLSSPQVSTANIAFHHVPDTASSSREFLVTGVTDGFVTSIPWAHLDETYSNKAHFNIQNTGSVATSYTITVKAATMVTSGGGSDSTGTDGIDAVPEALATTKGQIIVSQGINEFAVLNPGPPGYILKCDPTTSLGVVWDSSGGVVGERIDELSTGLPPDDGIPPVVPIGISIVAAIRSIILRWTPNSEADMINGWGQYQVQMSTVNTFTSPTLYNVGSNYLVVAGTNLIPGTTYYFRLRAVDGNGNASDWSATFSASVALIATVDYTPLSITSTVIANNSISTPKLQANAVTANEIAAGSITALKIAANTITAGQIAANTITAGQLAADSVTAVELAAITLDVGKYIQGGWNGGEIEDATDTAGFRIQANGNAKFNNVTIRGEVLGSLISGSRFETAATGSRVVIDSTDFQQGISFWTDDPIQTSAAQIYTSTDPTLGLISLTAPTFDDDDPGITPPIFSFGVVRGTGGNSLFNVDADDIQFNGVSFNKPPLAWKERTGGAPQTISSSSSVQTTVVWNNDVRVNGASVDLDGGTSTFTMHDPGIYMVNVTIGWQDAAHGTGTRLLELFVDGTTRKILDTRLASLGIDTFVNASYPIISDGTTTLQIRVRQNSSDDVDITANCLIARMSA